MTQSNDKNIITNTVNTVMGVKDKAHQNSYQLGGDTPELDLPLLIKYILGTIVQIGAMTAFLWALNQGFQLLETNQVSTTILNTLTCVVFIIFSIRSRAFSPLDNTRSRSLYDNIQRPAWAPPPLAFPIVWMSIAVLRVISSYLVWSQCDRNFLALPLIIFVIHLALGDTWNTVFTVEGRLGFAVPVVILGPLLSVFAVTWIYGQTLPTAGWILFPSCIWLTIASVLVYSIWQLNGKEPMYPLKLKN